MLIKRYCQEHGLQPDKKLPPVHQQKLRAFVEQHAERELRPRADVRPASGGHPAWGGGGLRGDGGAAPRGAVPAPRAAAAPPVPGLRAGYQPAAPHLMGAVPWQPTAAQLQRSPGQLVSTGAPSPGYHHLQYAQQQQQQQQQVPFLVHNGVVQSRVMHNGVVHNGVVHNGVTYAAQPFPGQPEWAVAAARAPYGAPAAVQQAAAQTSPRLQAWTTAGAAYTAASAPQASPRLPAAAAQQTQGQQLRATVPLHSPGAASAVGSQPAPRLPPQPSTLYAAAAAQQQPQQQQPQQQQQQHRLPPLPAMATPANGVLPGPQVSHYAPSALWRGA